MVARELFRTLSGIIISFTMIRFLDVFDIENRRRWEHAERTQAVLRERERISRDLHDGTIQAIYGVGLRLENATYLLRENPEGGIKELSGCMSRLNDIISNLRNYVMGLSSGRGDLVTRLRELVEEFNFRIPARLVVEGLPPAGASDAVSDHIYHVAQEALHNAARHACPSRVEVRLVLAPEMMELNIVDDGVGFHPGEVRTGRGNGLGNMSERARLIGAELTVNSAPGRGTRVTLRIPSPREGVSNYKDIAG